VVSAGIVGGDGIEYAGMLIAIQLKQQFFHSDSSSED
jgi:hypothetical protein